MKVVNYKTFATNKEFTQWQLDSEPQIVNVSPFMMEIGMKLNEKDNNVDGSAQTSVGVFVTYFTEIDDSDSEESTY